MQTREEYVVNTVEEKIQKEFWDTIDLINSFKGREEELVEKDPRYQAAHLEMLTGVLQVIARRIADESNLPTCSICQLPYEGYGNNAWPINDGRCCDGCNWSTVIQARIRSIRAA
jgi:hypothetical protein